MSGKVTTEKKGAYALLTINRPEALNALNSEVLHDLKNAVQEAARDDSLRLIIITGAGDKAFVSGGDIREMKDLTPRQAEDFARLGHETLNLIYRADLISIAAINGFALGGGLELAMACDIRVASSNAKLGLPEVGLGVIPGFGGTQRLVRLIGRGHALEIILSGEMIDADRAEKIGLVNHVFKADDLIPKTIQFAERMLLNKGPAAQKMARWLIHSGMDLPLAAGLEREITSFSELFSGKEPREGMAAHLEKRDPKF